MFDQHGSRERVIAHAIAPHPGITEWQCQKEYDRQKSFVFREPTQAISASSTGVHPGFCGKVLKLSSH
jgi:hypothetical protein